MRTPDLRNLSLGLVVAALASLVSCSVRVALTPSSANTPILPTLTPLSVAVSLLSPSPAVSIDAAVASLVPPTRTTRPMPTPTPSAGEEQALVLSLLQDNRGCQLPCWWGFTPGETSWHTVEAFFTSLGKEIWEYRDSQTASFGVYFDIPHQLAINQHYTVSDGAIRMISVEAIPPVRDNEIAYGDARFASALELYSLSNMLDAYGHPSHIYLGVARSTPWLPFDLLLFYPEKGILARYAGPTERDGGVLRVCPYQAVIALWLWSPERDLTLEDIPNVGGYTADEVSDFLPLQDATAMSIGQFYEIFIQPDNQVCLETIIEVW